MNPQVDSTIAAGALTALATIVAAVIGLWKRGDRSGQRAGAPPSIRGTWHCVWYVRNSGSGVERFDSELFVTKEDGGRFSGYSLSRDSKEAVGKRWDAEGVFDGNLLQVIYRPSRKSKLKDLRDHWCDILAKDDYGFSGRTVGIAFDRNKIEAAYVTLIRPAALPVWEQQVFMHLNAAANSGNPEAETL